MPDEAATSAVGGESAVEQLDAFQVALQAARKRRRARTIVLVLSFAAVGFGGESWKRMTDRKKALAGAGTAWVSYARCLWGSPLEPGEKPRTRLLRMELGLPQAAGATVDHDWPGRCSPLAETMSRAAADAGLAGVPEFQRLSALSARAAEATLWSNEPALPDDLWSAAAAAGLPALAATLDPSAPRPARPLTATSVPALPVPFPSRGERADVVDHDKLLLRFNGPHQQATTLCTFGAGSGGPLSLVHCEDASNVVSEKRLTLESFIRTAPNRFDRFELVRPRMDTNPIVADLPPGTRAAGIFGGQLLWVMPGPHEPDVLRARTVPGDDGPLGPEMVLGDLSGRSHEFATCKTGDTLAVRVRSYDGKLGAQKSWAHVAFFSGGSWTLSRSGAVADNAARFSCTESRASLTWLEDDVLMEVRCTAEGCESAHSDPLEHAWSHLHPLLADDLDGKVILVGITDGTGPISPSLVHSLRMRLAGIADIARSPDVVLWGDAQHEGVDPSEARLFVEHGAAVILLSTADDANRAIRVDGTGQYESIPIAKN